MLWFARAAITKFHILGGLESRNLLLQSSRDQKFKDKVLSEG